MTELYIFTSTLREFLRLKRLIGWIFVILGVAVISWVFVHELPKFNGQDGYILLSATLVFRILPLCAAIYSTAVMSQEASQRTIVYLLTRPIARWKILTFRSLAAIVTVFLISAATEITMSLVARGASNSLLLPDLGAILAGSAAYTALFIFVSLLINRSMIVCLLFSFVWETAVPAMPGDLYRLSISGYLTSIAHRPPVESASGGLDALAGLLGVNIIPSWVGWATMLAMTAVCLTVGALWFTNFEYMASEDGE